MNGVGLIAILAMIGALAAIATWTGSRCRPSMVAENGLHKIGAAVAAARGESDRLSALALSDEHIAGDVAVQEPTLAYRRATVRRIERHGGAS